MAKGNLVLGTLRGKLGDVVAYRSLGQQMARVRVRNVKNPKTQLQTLQRLVLACAAKTVSTMSGILDHSFQSVAYGAESTRYARKQIMKVLREQMVAAYNDEARTTAAQQVGCFPSYASGAAVAAFPVSQGSLPQIPCEVVNNGQGFISAVVEFSTTLTVAELCAALGVSIDTQLTFVFLTPKRITAEGETPAFYNADFRVARVNFLSTAADLPVFVATSATEGSPLILSSAVVDTERSTDWLRLLFGRGEADAQSIQYDYVNTQTISGSNACAGFAVIASKWDGSKWLRSTQTLAVGYPVTTSGASAAQSWAAFNFFEDLMDNEEQQQAVAEDRYLNKEKN